MLTTKEHVIKNIVGLGYKLVKKFNDNYIFFPENLKI